MSKISWTDKNWNVWDGCTEASAGCNNCYAARIAHRLWGERKFSNIQLHPDRLYKPLYWRKPRKVFVNSMGDFFHADVPKEWRDKQMAVMALCPQHTFQILTKRHKIMWNYLIDPLLPERLFHAALSLISEFSGKFQERMKQAVKRNTSRKVQRTLCLPLSNVWFGISVENHQQRRIRIPYLLQTPAKVRFLSVEPLLEGFVIGSKEGCLISAPVRDCGHQADIDYTCCYPDSTFWDCPSEVLDWVIVGGESGPGARFCDPKWIADVAQSAQQFGAAVWVKQLGSNCGLNLKGKGEDWGDPNFPEYLKIRQFPVG